MILVILADWN